MYTAPRAGLDDAVPASGLLGSGYARYAVEAARQASLKERRDGEAFDALSVP